MNAATTQENLSVQTVAAGRELTIFAQPLCMFARSKLNMRKKEGTNIPELAALILSQGLLQNLIGYTQKKKGKPTGIIEVVAGGRRLAALHLLLAERKITDDYPVTYKLVSEEEAIVVSLAENSGREAVHLADQFEAMQALIGRGKSIEDVAAAFGMSPLTVQRRLKLTNVSPRLFALFRQDEVDLEQMMALAQTDDPAAQEQVWDGLPEYDRQAWRIRKLLTNNEIDLKSNSVARYVGVAAYERAGGVVRRDLFADDDSGFMTDAVLLETLAQAKLQKAAKQVEKEGWTWVQVHTRLEYNERHAYGRVRTMRRTPTDAEQAQLDALAREQDKIESEYDAANAEDRETIDALERGQEALDEKLEALETALEMPDPDDQAVGGAIVTISDAGKCEFLRGLARPDDQRVLNRIEKGADGTKDKPLHSERLTRQLTAHRTAALQAVLATRPDVALVALTARLAKQVFSQYRCGQHIVKVNLTECHLKTSTANIEESRAWKELQAKRGEWVQHVPSDDEQSLFAWLIDQPQAVVLDLLAFFTESSLDAVQSREVESPEFNELAKAVSLKMTEWWAPTKDT
jgi:ParB family chromosome partitioning protein